MSARRLVCAVAVGVTVASVVAWLATGGEMFTRWPNARLEASDTAVMAEESELLDELGLRTPQELGAGSIESRFAFGLLPGGADPAHLFSAATVTLLAALASGSVVALHRARSRKPQRDSFT
jgi:hypothetical protein